jgi:hypothetical protein
MTGWNEQRHGTDPVDVGLQQRGEGVFHRGGQHHDDHGLGPDENCLPAEQDHQHGPRGGPEQRLPHQFHPVQAGYRVDHQDRADPGHHAGSDPEVSPTDIRHASVIPGEPERTGSCAM